VMTDCLFDADRLREVIEEIAEWTLDQRRGYLTDIGKVFGPEAVQQIKDGLTELWRSKNG